MLSTFQTIDTVVKKYSRINIVLGRFKITVLVTFLIAWTKFLAETTERGEEFILTYNSEGTIHHGVEE